MSIFERSSALGDRDCLLSPYRLTIGADQRLVTLGLPKRYGRPNPFSFMALQDVQEHTNFFERRVSAYQVGVRGEIALDSVF